MVTDKNKAIATIEYNHLNLPAKVTKNDGQYVKYIYNAAGMKLSQEVYNESDVIQKKTDYLGEFIYENDVLQFINHEEGRVVMTGEEREYQYTLKDHLGNTRITFTSEHEVETFTATMDNGKQQEEQQVFGAYNSYVNQPLDPTPAESPTDQILILNGSTLSGSNNGQVGLTKSFGVVPGDIVTASVNAKYSETTSGNGNLAGFAAALTQAFGLTPGSPPIEGISPFEALNAFGSVIATGGRDGEETLPQGYLNILVFDQEHNLVDAAFEQVGNSTTLTSTVEIRQPGFVYVFLSNDGNSQQQIGFDNYEVTHEHSDVIQQDDYYAFGLTFNSYQRENSTENRYLYNQGAGEKKFNTERILDLGLNIDLTKYRAYDPALGRWWQVDPLADEADFTSLTPYNYSFNNPVRYNDPYGDCPPDDPDCGGGSSSSGSDGPSMADLIDQAAGVFDTIVGFLFGDGNDGSAESAASFGNAMNTAPVLSEQAQEMKSNIEGTLGQVPGLNVALNVMDASQAKTTGETMKHLGKAALNANSIPIRGAGPKQPITGHTKHGLNQSIGRDGGRGVNAKAKLDAVTSPVKTVTQSGGRTQYVGTKAKVTLNSRGKVITVTGTNRGSKQYTYGNGNAAQRKAKSKGLEFDPKTIR